VIEPRYGRVLRSSRRRRRRVTGARWGSGWMRRIVTARPVGPQLQVSFASCP